MAKGDIEMAANAETINNLFNFACMFVIVFILFLKMGVAKTKKFNAFAKKIVL